MAQSQTPNEGPTSHPPPPPPLLAPPPQPSSRQIQKVPQLLLKEEQNYQDYMPKVVSIGPYHHGKPELRLTESVKPMTLKMVVLENEDFYYQEIQKEIINIRNCYEKEFTDLYSDDELVRMMLLDACFIMIHIETSMPPLRPSDEVMLRQTYFFMFQTLGMLTMSIVLRDMFLLENQIPLWIVKLLLSSRYNKDESNDLLHRYLTRSLFGEFRPKRGSPSENEEEFHLLEAFHRLVVFDFAHEPKRSCLNFINCKFFCCFRAKEKTVPDPRNDANPNSDLESGESSRSISRFRSRVNELKARACRGLSKNLHKGDHAKEDLKKFVHSFRSATNLKAKGIHFKPSPTQSLKDVKFKTNWIYGKLQLPTWGVSIYTKVFFVNMTAYELSPNNPSQGVVTTYINLMKSLIVRPEDVKELREKKILYCMLGSDEQILKVYQDINTYGADNPMIFQDVKDRVQSHYNNKGKIWMAELTHTYFRSPWTFITLLAATCLLVLTFLQTIYTMKS